MPTYSVTNPKKFLDADGLAYFSRKLNNYPTNDVIEAVVEGIQDALDEKADKIRFNTTAGWASHNSEVPAAGEIIIYTDKYTITDEFDNEIPIPGIKVGNGNAYLGDLTFVGDDVLYAINTRLSAHENNTDIHTTSAEKTFWNNKLNCHTTGETLVFDRN